MLQDGRIYVDQAAMWRDINEIRNRQDRPKELIAVFFGDATKSHLSITVHPDNHITYAPLPNHPRFNKFFEINIPLDIYKQLEE